MLAAATCLALSSVDEPVDVGGGAVDMVIEVKDKDGVEIGQIGRRRKAWMPGCN